MSLHNHYFEYLKEFAPGAEEIANELLSRDNSVKFLRKRITDLKKENERLREVLIDAAEALESTRMNQERANIKLNLIMFKE